jgi:DNA-binding LytR/AlgR family response regulator
MKFNCVIADDEPIARDIIQQYIGHLDYLQVTAACSNAMEAKTVLQQQRVDILFLDINMPVMDGISFLKTLRNPPQVIFTTAYKEYAVEGFDLAACDYLLKPFSFERFVMAIDKATDRLQANQGGFTETVIAPAPDAIFIKTDGKIFNIVLNDLLYAEANGNYTKIVMQAQTLLPAMRFTSLEELLPPALFLRVHRSFIINKTKIGHIEGNRVFIHNAEIPIGSNYKEAFLRALGLKND